MNYALHASKTTEKLAELNTFKPRKAKSLQHYCSKLRSKITVVNYEYPSLNGGSI